MSGTSVLEVYWDSKRHGIYLTRMPDVAPTGDASTRVVLAKFTTTTKPLIASSRTTIPRSPHPLYHCVCVICGLYIEVPIADGSARPYGELFAYLTGYPAHYSGEPSRRVDELVSVKFYFRPYASDNVLRVACTFMAVNKCTKRLSGLYRNLKTSVDTIPLAKVMWPILTADPPESAEGTQELEFSSMTKKLRGSWTGFSGGCLILYSPV